MKCESFFVFFGFWCSQIKEQNNWISHSTFKIWETPFRCNSHTQLAAMTVTSCFLSAQMKKRVRFITSCLICHFCSLWALNSISRFVLMFQFSHFRHEHKCWKGYIVATKLNSALLLHKTSYFIISLDCIYFTFTLITKKKITKQLNYQEIKLNKKYFLFYISSLDS